MTHDEWFKEKFPSRHKKGGEVWMNTRDAWNACLENQKLGVVVDGREDQLRFSAWHNYFIGNNSIPTKEFVLRSTIWNAALKYARGIS